MKVTGKILVVLGELIDSYGYQDEVLMEHSEDLVEIIDNVEEIFNFEKEEDAGYPTRLTILKGAHNGE